MDKPVNVIELREAVQWTWGSTSKIARGFEILIEHAPADVIAAYYAILEKYDKISQTVYNSKGNI